MGIIDRAKVLQNLAFGEDGGAYIPVTTLHTSGAMTSGGHAGVATTEGCHDLDLSGEVGVSSDGLARLLRNLDEDAPHIEMQGNVLRIKTETSDYAISTTEAVLKAAPGSFPGTNSLNASDPTIERTLKLFGNYASRDLGRPHLQNIFFSPEGITALDGYCVADLRVPLAGLSENFCVPEVCVRAAMKRLYGGFGMRFTQEKTAFFDDDTRWVVANNEGDWKPYQDFIPAEKEFNTQITFDSELPAAIKAVSDATGSENVFLQFDGGKIEIYAESGSCTAKEIYKTQNDLKAKIKFRAKWCVQAMRDGLKVYDAPTLHIVSDKRPAVVVALNSRFAISPMDSRG